MTTRSFPQLVAVACVAAVLVAPGRAPARTPLPAAALAVLKERFPGLQPLSHALGPLHASGVSDAAVVLGRGEHGVRLVAVLRGDAQGGWRFANASGDVDAACAGCDVQVRIRDAGLEVGTSDPGARVATVRTWRFAYRGARGEMLRLVAVRSERVAPAEAGPGAVRAVSADLLTGEKLEVDEPAGAGGGGRRERRSRVPLRQPIAFDQFAWEFRGEAPETHFAPEHTLAAR